MSHPISGCVVDSHAIQDNDKYPDLKPDPLFLKITEEITKKKVVEVRDHGGSDARFLSEKGIPVLISRPLVGQLHSEEEWIDIDSMVTFYRIYEAYITKKLLV